MLTQIFAAIQNYAWTILWTGGVLTALEMVVPQSRYPIVTRMRGLLFWSIYILITASVMTLLQAMWTKLGARPWITLHFAAWFDRPYFRLIGLVAAPLLAITLFEFFYYWFHRMQHTVPFFWRFHSVHHSLREMSAWNSNHHFTEEIFRIPFITMPMSLLISADPGPSPFVIASILALQPLYEHSCVRFGLGPIRYLISDNRYHRLHHSIEPRHVNKNFGSFMPVWDMLFRTAHFPTKTEWPQTGIADVDEPRTITEFLLRPFRQTSSSEVPQPELSGSAINLRIDAAARK